MTSKRVRAVRKSRKTLSAGRWVLTTLVAIIALILTACGSSDDGEVDLSKELPTEIPAGTKIVWADQQNKYQTLLAASGLDKDLPYKLGTRTSPAVRRSWRHSAPAPPTSPVWAMCRRYMRSSPTRRYRSSWRCRPASTRIRLPPHRSQRCRPPPTCAAEDRLRRGSTAQQAAVLRAIDNAGLKVSDVTLVKLKLAEFSDALGANQVDIAPAQ